MRARRFTTASFVLAALTFMAMALPAASEEVGTEGVSHDNGVQIRNPDNANDQFLELYGDANDLTDLWGILNREGSNDLHFVDGNGDGSFDRHMVIEQGTGRVGLGTTSPAANLEIEDSKPHIQLNAVGDGFFDLFSEAGFFQIDSSETGIGPSQVLVDKDAPSSSLVVDRDGVGIGTTSPQADIEIHNITGSARGEFRVVNGGEAWANGVQSAGNFLFSKAGTGGNELIGRQRNHGTATIDVQGPVRATEFKTVSSREYKTDQQPVDPAETLNKLNQLDVTSWRFKACRSGEGHVEDDHGNVTPCTGPGTGPRHIGPMAEDFRETFGLGEGESIATVDADGVMMAAIQSLTHQLEEKDATIAELEEQATARDERIDELEARLQALEAKGHAAGTPAVDTP